MKSLLPIFILILLAARLEGQSLPGAAPSAAPISVQTGAQSTASAPSAEAPIPMDEKNAHQARDLINKAIQALGGPAYLTAHDMQEQGRVYSFYHGRPTSDGVFFWRFQEFPDKERIELTPQRDIAHIYV